VEPSPPPPLPPGYPEAYAADVVLTDGGTVHVRPVRPDDGEILHAMHQRLSAQSQYFRFFTPRPRLTAKEIERFTTVDYRDRMALVALLGDDMVGIARYDRWPGRDDAEVAFTIDDAHHGRGIATVLLELLAVRAREVGINRFTAEVLPENRPMLGVFRSAGWEVRNEFAGGVVEVSFDIHPTPKAVAAMEAREQQAESRSVARLLAPRSIAVVGAGRHPHSIGAWVVRNLVARGFDGPVYPINPFVPYAASVHTWPSVVDVPDEVDLAVVAVPAEAVRQVLEDCAAKHVRAVVVISAGFADAGPERLRDQRALVELARGHGMRLLGPASLGFIVTGPTSSLHASFAPVSPLPGRVAISSQSGSLGAAMLEAAARLGLGISTFVSLGNKGDVSGNDLLQFWQDDPRTDVVLMYTESFGNPRKFARIARRVSRVKPVVAVMSGDGDSPLVTDALYQQAGVIRVTTVAELLAVARLLAGQPLPEGHRVAVVTNSASPALLALAAARSAGLVPAQLSEATRAAVLDGLPPDVRVGAFVDLSPQAGPEDVARVLPLVLADPGVDAVTVIHAPPVARGTEELRSILTTAARGSTKPLVAVALGLAEGMAADDDAVRAAAEGDQQPSQAGQVPLYTFPEAAMAALGRVARYAAWRRRPEGVPLQPEGVDLARIEALVADVLAVHPDGATLPFERCVALLAAAGVPFADARVVGDAASAAEAADDLGYPVALKATGVQRLARSERGGVGLDLQSPAEVRAAYARMAASLGERMGGAVVQRMVPPGVELSAELRLEPLGPVLTFGLGGAYADLIADRSARVLPLTDHDAADLLAGSRAAPLVADVPGLHAALVDLFGRLATVVDAVPELVHLRLNPMLGSAEGLWAVDVTASVAPARVPEGFRRVL